MQQINIFAAFIALGVSNITRAQYAGALPVAPNLRPGFDAINIDDSKRILAFLSTKCDGRGTGQPGFEKAASFVAKEFGRTGLKPLGDNGTYFQKADVTAPRDLYAEFRGPGGAREFFAKDFTCVFNGGARFSGSITGSGLPLFIEYGGLPGKLPSLEDLHGRVVFLHFPNALFDDPTQEPALDDFFDRVSAAQPAAFFGVQDDLEAAKKAFQNPFFHGPLWTLEQAPNATISSTVDNLSMSATADIEELAEIARIKPAPRGTSTVTAGKEPLSFAIKGKVENKETENVVGLLEGSDPQLKGEYVVVGGHLDHFGVQNGVVYPGADDDGSGATDVIEIARAMAANPVKPRRSVIFIAFFGEEQGLLGSRFFVKHPPVPLDKIVAELQMDMVARDAEGDQQESKYGGPNPSRFEHAADNVDTIRIIGSKRLSIEIDRALRDANSYVNFRIKDDSEYLYGLSDDSQFAKKGIPTAWLFSGFHPDYHQSTDTVDKIDWVKLTNSAKLLYLAAHEIADADARPVNNRQSGAHG